MLRLFILLAALLGLAAGVLLVPIGGRTLADRWRSSRQGPAEHYTPAERRALDRLLSDRAR